MGTFVEKGVIVAGAISGLGEAAALKFAREGAGFVSGAVRLDSCTTWLY